MVCYFLLAQFHKVLSISTFCCEGGRGISSSSEFKRSGGGGGKFSIEPRGVVELDPSLPNPFAIALDSLSDILYWEFAAMCGCGAGGGGGEADTICVGDVTSDVEEVTDDVRRIGGFGRFPLLPPEVTFMY